MLKKLVISMLFVSSAMIVGGCCEAENRKIAELTLNKQDLEGQLQNMKSELDDKEAELAKLQDQLAALRGQKGELEKRLAMQPKMPAGWEIKKGMAMTSLPEAVLFDSGKADLKSSAQARLDRVIRDIRANFPGKDVYIVGHTDTDPIRRSKWKDNLELSLHRGGAVTRYLISHGLSTKQVVAGGAGEYRPIAPDTSKAEKQKNRRVEFWILKPL
jgi:chemotaxis protein MotB